MKDMYILSSGVLYADNESKVQNKSKLTPYNPLTRSKRLSLEAKHCKDFNPVNYLGPTGWKFYSRPAQLINSVLEDIKTTKMNEENFSGGVYIGSAFSNKNTISTYEYKSRLNGLTAVKVKETPSILANFPAGTVASRSKFRGPNFTFTNGSFSGITALETAYYHLLQGRISEALVGGVEEFSEIEKNYILNTFPQYKGSFHEAASLILLSDKSQNQSEKKLLIKGLHSSHIDMAQDTLQLVLENVNIDQTKIKNIIISNEFDAYTENFEINLINNFFGNKDNLYLFTVNEFEQNFYTNRVFTIFDTLNKDDNIQSGYYLILTTEEQYFSAVLVEKKW